MSKADEMFGDLGYDIDSTYEGEGHLYYCKNNTKNEKVKELGWLEDE